MSRNLQRGWQFYLEIAGEQMKEIKLLTNVYPTVYFGKYWLSNAVIPLEKYIKCPIEWLVLDVDVKKNQILLLSKNIIEMGAFSNGSIFETRVKTSWEKSFAREFLNSEFYKEAFTDEEQASIREIYVGATAAGSRRCIDKIFLLSKDEVKKYLPKGKSDVAIWPYIANPFHSGTEERPLEISYQPMAWWTRTSGKTDDLAVCVGSDGEFYEISSGLDEIGIRPAMWVSL